MGKALEDRLTAEFGSVDKFKREVVSAFMTVFVCT